VVARGSGTGLSGGALPLADGILLSMGKFNRILGIDPLARTARAQPGVRNAQITEAAAPLGLYYAPDPSSQIACSIGGNVAGIPAACTQMQPHRAQHPEGARPRSRATTWSSAATRWMRPATTCSP
jgi:hypothetical protein